MVESDAFELHPVSNEIEFDDVEAVKYRRLDEETLHARVAIRDLGLTVVYLWCADDKEGGGAGWRVAEAIPLDNPDEPSSLPWLSTIPEANANSVRRHVSASTRNESMPATNGTQNGISKAADNFEDSSDEEEEEDDDDDNDDDNDYWAQYDNAPMTTPGPDPSAPAGTSKPNGHSRTDSETDYFARYSHVQPEMDNEDPDQDEAAIGESTLNGSTILSTSEKPPAAARQIPSVVDTRSTELKAPQPHSPLRNSFLPEGANDDEPDPLRLGSASPAGSVGAVEKLEDSAMLQSKTELAVRHHIGASVKSLWRLARSTGMELGEFEGVVRTEVEVLRVVEESEEEGGS